MIKVGMVSLGCAKNLVDSEMVLAMFPSGTFKIVSNPKEADLIIVNTCAFILPAKTESIDTIMEMASYGAKIVVIGCLAERYAEQLEQELKEASLIVPIHDYPSLHKYLSSLLKETVNPIDPLNRVISTPSFSCYLRISDGCDNMCAFCAIPLIRGRFKSRPLEEIIAEANKLKAQGYKEITLISQDTANYGKDFPNRKPNFASLLRELEKVGLESIRLLYLYPDEITDEIIDIVSHSKTIAHYFDIPVQSGSDNVLKMMNRHDTVKKTKAVLEKIREKCPDAILRTTLIAGFPGETEQDHQDTLSFIKYIRFDHLGCFPYSKEEGTRAASYPNQVHPSTKKRRVKDILLLQKEISRENNAKRVGLVFEGFVTGYDPIKKMYTLRSSFNAPDGIDGTIYFSCSKCLRTGEKATVKILKADDYDLYGAAI